MLNSANNLLRKIDKVAEEDGRYKREAYLFVYAALEFAVHKLKRDQVETAKARHITGRELSEHIAVYAQEQYGPMARPVFEHWGVQKTLDFGRIVFNLVEAELMSKTEEDRLEDFQDVYDFDEVFDPKKIQDNLSQFDLERL